MVPGKKLVRVNRVGARGEYLIAFGPKDGYYLGITVVKAMTVPDKETRYLVTLVG